MKSAYELAMERLKETQPAVRLTNAQKQQLAELDSQYAAKIAGREIAIKSEMARATDPEKAESLRQQLITDRKKIQAELEEKKEAVRRASSKTK